MTNITINLTYDKDEKSWGANVSEMPGCITFGDDLHEVLEMIEDAMRGWANILIQNGTAWQVPAAEVVDADTKRSTYNLKPRITQYRYHAVFQGYTADRLPLTTAAEVTTKEPIMEEWQIESITSQSKKELGETRVCTNLQLLAVEKNGIWVPA